MTSRKRNMIWWHAIYFYYILFFWLKFGYVHFYASTVFR
jgi:hypothetical protein